MFAVNYIKKVFAYLIAVTIAQTTN